MGLSRVVHPLPAMTLQAKQMLVQDNQAMVPKPTSRVPGSWGAQRSGSLLGQKGEPTGLQAHHSPPHQSLSSVLQTRLWVTFPFNMKGLS